MTSTQTTAGARLLARCARGLEWVCAAEIQGRLNAPIVGLQHREIHFDVATLDAGVLALGTVDDVFVTCGVLEGIDHTRASLQVLRQAARQIDFNAALAVLGSVREVQYPGRFDVVASFLGKRNYNRFDIENAVGGAVAAQLGAVQLGPLDRAEADVSWRVHLRQGQAYVGLRIPPRPLHRRAYKIDSQPGTLHPPIACALALLAGIRGGAVLLDPFCGSGTVPIEAARLDADLTPCACDIDPSTVGLARTNAEHAHAPVSFAVADAAQLPLSYRAIDRVACNLPWGRTVEQKGELASDTIPFWQELSRVLHSEGRAAVLSETALPTASHLKHAGLTLVHRHEVRVSGRWSVLSIVVPEANRDAEPIDCYALYGTELRESLERRAERSEM